MIYWLIFYIFIFDLKLITHKNIFVLIYTFIVLNFQYLDISLLLNSIYLFIHSLTYLFNL